VSGNRRRLSAAQKGAVMLFSGAGALAGAAVFGGGAGDVVLGAVVAAIVLVGWR